MPEEAKFEPSFSKLDKLHKLKPGDEVTYTSGEYGSKLQVKAIVAGNPGETAVPVKIIEIIQQGPELDFVVGSTFLAGAEELF